jgi:hypothetical protein
MKRPLPAALPLPPREATRMANPYAPLQTDAPLPRWLRWVLGAVAVATTLGVFALYQRPGFLVNLADQLWACF